MEFEASILVDVVMVSGVPVIPLVVGLDITTWVVSVGSSVQVYIYSLLINCTHHMLLHV